MRYCFGFLILIITSGCVHQETGQVEPPFEYSLHYEGTRRFEVDTEEVAANWYSLDVEYSDFFVYYASVYWDKEDRDSVSGEDSPWKYFDLPDGTVFTIAGYVGGIMDRFSSAYVTDGDNEKEEVFEFSGTGISTAGSFGMYLVGMDKTLKERIFFWYLKRLGSHPDEWNLKAMEVFSEGDYFVLCFNQPASQYPKYQRSEHEYMHFPDMADSLFAVIEINIFYGPPVTNPVFNPSADDFVKCEATFESTKGKNSIMDQVRIHEGKLKFYERHKLENPIVVEKPELVLDRLIYRVRKIDWIPHQGGEVDSFSGGNRRTQFFFTVGGQEYVIAHRQGELVTWLFFPNGEIYKTSSNEGILGVFNDSRNPTDQP